MNAITYIKIFKSHSKHIYIKYKYIKESINIRILFHDLYIKYISIVFLYCLNYVAFISKRFEELSEGSCSFSRNIRGLIDNM